MPRPLNAPSRIEPLNFPVFGMSWWANPGNGTSVLAYCGGGGSARTGVNNFIRVQSPPNDDQDILNIDTGDNVGVALKIMQNPVTGVLWLFVALGHEVMRFHLPSGANAGEIQVKNSDGVNCVACSVMCDRLAVGCDNGSIKIYDISDDIFDGLLAPRFVCDGHTKAVCAIDFCNRGGRMVSSAKDGTARVWDQDGHCLAELVCLVEGGKHQGGNKKSTKNARAPNQVLVRGCAFGDLDGKIVYTVASARRGSAFLSRWMESPEQPGTFACERTEVSQHPISAMSISVDGGLVALGAVDGTIILWSVPDWTPLRIFLEVHDLPVTCIAARPWDCALNGEDDGVPIHAISASADSRLAHLTLVKRPPKKKGGGKEGRAITIIWNIVVAFAVAYAALLKPVRRQTQALCGQQDQAWNWHEWMECVLHEVLLARSTDPGILTPPH